MTALLEIVVVPVLGVEDQDDSLALDGLAHADLVD